MSKQNAMSSSELAHEKNPHKSQDPLNDVRPALWFMQPPTDTSQESDGWSGGGEGEPGPERPRSRVAVSALHTQRDNQGLLPVPLIGTAHGKLS